MIIRWVKKKGFRYLQLFSPGYPATPETVLKPERGSFIYILTWSWLVKGTKFSTSLPPYVGFAFLYPIRDQHRKLLFPRGSTRPIPKLLFSQMVRCESVTLSLIVVVYVYSYVYWKWNILAVPSTSESAIQTYCTICLYLLRTICCLGSIAHLFYF